MNFQKPILCGSVTKNEMYLKKTESFDKKVKINIGTLFLLV